MEATQPRLARGMRDLLPAAARRRRYVIDTLRQTFETYGSPPFVATAREQFGRWLLDQGRSVEAAELLDAARTTYTTLGARAWLARLESAAPAAT